MEAYHRRLKANIQIRRPSITLFIREIMNVFEDVEIKLEKHSQGFETRNRNLRNVDNLRQRQRNFRKFQETNWKIRPYLRAQAWTSQGCFDRMGKQLTRTGGAHLPLDPETLTFDEEDGEPYGWDIGQIRFGSEALRELRADPAVQEAQQQLESSTVAEDEEFLSEEAVWDPDGQKRQEVEAYIHNCENNEAVLDSISERNDIRRLFDTGHLDTIPEIQGPLDEAQEAHLQKLRETFEGDDEDDKSKKSAGWKAREKELKKREKKEERHRKREAIAGKTLKRSHEVRKIIRNRKITPEKAGDFLRRNESPYYESKLTIFLVFLKAITCFL